MDRPPGGATELLREREGVNRADQDAFALATHRRAAEARDAGFDDDQVVAVRGGELARGGSIRIGTTADKLAELKPVFRTDGTVTPGNASPVNDGASAALLGTERPAAVLGRRPPARVAGWAAAANQPQFFGFAPADAADRALKRAGIGCVMPMPWS